MGQRTLGAQISHALAARGVEVIFGIPGVHNVEMYRGISEAGITHVLARHEQGAGFMADGYARASARPGVCYGISGPGLTNLLTPLGQAYSDSVPVLAVTSCLDEVASRRGQLHQMLDQVGAARGVCDWSEVAVSAPAAYGLIDRAFAEFAAGRARSRHITVPIAQLQAMADGAPAPGRLPARAMPNPEAIAEAAKLLRGARRPLVIFGGGAAAAAGPARALLAATGAASFTTYQGRGIVPGDDPLHFGAMLARPDSAEVCAGADLVLAIGTELAEVDLWRADLGHDCPLVRVDIDAEVLASTPAAVAIRADAGAVLEALVASDLGPPVRDWSAGEVARRRAMWMSNIEGERPGLIALAQAIQGALPEGCMVFSDMTQIAYVAKEVLPACAPGHWHHPCGFGTLGYALPAAIGGKVARGVAPVLALAGDYGFQYTLQELGVAVELGLSLPIVVWDNGKLKEIEDAMVAAQIPPNAVEALNPDFCALARAYGARAVQPGSLSEMQDAIGAAFEAQGPTLIHVTPEVFGAAG